MMKKEDLEVLASIYALAYNEANVGETWDKKSARKILQYFFEKQPDLAFVAEYENKIVGAVLSGAAARGANQVGSLTFSVDDPKKAKEEARAIAIKDAREKAGRLSADLGVSLKKIVNYGESGGGGPQPIYAQADFGFGKGGGFPVPAPSGENEIIITVNLTYEIK